MNTLSLLNLTTLLIIALPASLHAGKTDPNPSFQKLVKNATHVIVRDYGSNSKVEKNHKIIFEVTKKKDLDALRKNLTFKRGAWSNGCDCWGYPRMDWYQGDKLIGVMGFKHGSGIIYGSTVVPFTPDSQEWAIQWLVKNGVDKKKLQLPRADDK